MNAAAGSPSVMLDHAGLADDVHDLGRAAGVARAADAAELQEDLRVGRAALPHRADARRRPRMEDGDEPRDAALDDLLVDDVGLVEPASGYASGVFSTLTASAGRFGIGLPPAGGGR